MSTQKIVIPASPFIVGETLAAAQATINQSTNSIYFQTPTLPQALCPTTRPSSAPARWSVPSLAVWSQTGTTGHSHVQDYVGEWHSD